MAVAGVGRLAERRSHNSFRLKRRASAGRGLAQRPIPPGLNFEESLALTRRNRSKGIENVRLCGPPGAQKFCGVRGFGADVAVGQILGRIVPVLRNALETEEVEGDMKDGPSERDGNACLKKKRWYFSLVDIWHLS